MSGRDVNFSWITPGDYYVTVESVYNFGALPPPITAAFTAFSGETLSSRLIFVKVPDGTSFKQIYFVTLGRRPSMSFVYEGFRDSFGTTAYFNISIIRA